MPQPKPANDPDPRKDAARQDGTGTVEEKTRGAAPGADAGAAGEPEPKGRPTSDREATEGAAAAEIRGTTSGQGGRDADGPVRPDR
jgi:hypothetical protein